MPNDQLEERTTASDPDAVKDKALPMATCHKTAFCLYRRQFEAPALQVFQVICKCCRSHQKW